MIVLAAVVREFEHRQRLENQRNELVMGLGHHPIRDRQTRDRIAAIEAELQEIAGSSSSQSTEVPLGDAVSNPSPAPSIPGAELP